MLIVGAYINWEIKLTLYERLSFVSVRYYKTPTSPQKECGSFGNVLFAGVLVLASSNVLMGLQSTIWARSRMVSALCDQERWRPSNVWVTSIPRKWWAGPISFIANSELKSWMKFVNRRIKDPVRSISSTKRKKISVSELEWKINSDMSTRL